MIEQEPFDDVPISAEDIKTIIRKEMVQDKDILDRAQNAFVSFVRYYKEHAL